MKSKLNVSYRYLSSRVLTLFQEHSWAEDIWYVPISYTEFCSSG